MNFRLSLSPKNRGEEIVFSIPQSNHYQQIKNLQISPAPHLQILDQWGNEIFIFNDVLKIDIKFQAYLKELKVKKEMVKKFFVNDYHKLPKEQLIFYLQPNRFINGEDKQIKQIAKKIAGKEINLYQMIKKIYYYTLNYLTYANPIDDLYSYKQALLNKKTDCGGFSTFFLSLCHALKIPARLTVGFLVTNHKLKRIFSVLNVRNLTLDDLFIHAWPEILLPDGSWLPLDPSIEWRRKKRLTKRKGGWGEIPADRLVVSFGCDFNIKIGKKVYQFDLLQKPISIKSIVS